MAIVQTPLLSFGARGHIAKAITFRHSKRMDLASAYTVPADPKSPEQLAQRALFARAGSFWGTMLTSTRVREAWRRYAYISKRRTPPFQTFAGETLSRPLTPESYYYTTPILWSATDNVTNVRVLVKGINSKTFPPSNPDIDLYVGDAPDHLWYVAGSFYNVLFIAWSSIPIPPYPVYYQMRHSSGYPVSGILKRTTKTAY